MNSTPQDGAAPAPTPNPLDNLSLEQLIAEMAINRDTANREWKSRDIQGYHPAKARHESIRTYILQNFLRRSPQESPRPTTGATADYPQAAFARGVRHGLSTGAQTTEYGVLNVIREGWKQDCELRAIPAAPQEESRGSE